MMINFRRTVEQLELEASKFWPQDLSQQEAELSIIPKLLETQDAFIAILSLDLPGLEEFFDVINTANMSGSLFVKHLIILADFGGEQLKRINQVGSKLFADKMISYMWTAAPERIEERQYMFKAFPERKLSNPALQVDGKSLLLKRELTDIQKDAIAILLIGAASTDAETANILSRCEISNYLGQPDKLSRFIKQRYIWVSSITKGAQSNSLGQLAQKFVLNYIQENLQLPNVNIALNGKIPQISHVGAEDDRLTTFDLVVQQQDKYVAVEISFQVTTNSVIERKSGQAQARHEQIHAHGYKIAYVIDGAGNFERVSALRTICTYSDCTVAFSKSEMDVLCQFITLYFTGNA